jgi:hypothetical protein
MESIHTEEQIAENKAFEEEISERRSLMMRSFQ